MRPEDIVLFDMDGTLVDYEKTLNADMARLEAPNEPSYIEFSRGQLPDYLEARADLIRGRVSWWANLPKLNIGFDIWHLCTRLDLRKVILTQGSRKNPKSWMGKKMWIDSNISSETDVTITRDKSLMYGKVLVDDYPDYITKWLKWRPRGLVIMPAHYYNEGFEHVQVVRYNGGNYREVEKAIMLKIGGDHG